MTQLSKDKYKGGGIIEIKKFAQPKTQTCSKRVSQDLTVVPQRKINLNDTKNFFEMAVQKQLVQTDSLHHVTTKSQDEIPDKFKKNQPIINKSEKKQSSRIKLQISRPGSSYGVHKEEPRQIQIQSMNDYNRNTLAHQKPRPFSGLSNHSKQSASKLCLQNGGIYGNG